MGFLQLLRYSGLILKNASSKLHFLVLSCKIGFQKLSVLFLISTETLIGSGYTTHSVPLRVQVTPKLYQSTFKYL